MTTITYASTSPKFGLPLLFAGQAQKETFVNEAMSILDAMVCCAIESTTATPPANPTGGCNWLVGAGATGVWAGQDGKIASYQAGNWLFVTPPLGMLIYNKASGQFAHFDQSWKTPANVAAPSGGSVVDAEARQAITSLIGALRVAGVFSAA